MAGEYLKDFYTDPSVRKVIFGHEHSAGGSIAMYLPSNGEVGVDAEGYTLEILRNHPYMRYMFGAFGEPNIHTIHNEQELDEYNGAHVMAMQMRSELVKKAWRVGYKAGDVFHTLNDKQKFQELVQRVLGPEYSTNPFVLKAGQPLTAVNEAAQALLDHGHRVVVRIPDSEIALGGGRGVLFPEDRGQIVAFLQSINGAMHGEHLTTNVMIERMIPHIFSPSTTFYLGPDRVVPLSINAQIFDVKNPSRFVASTNILPPQAEAKREALWAVGTRLAEEAHQMGARNFMGIDLVLEDGQKTLRYKTNRKGINVIEANYRTTGSTHPWFIAMRAVNFIEQTDWANWVFVHDIPFTGKAPDISVILEQLRKCGILFEGQKNIRNDFADVQVVPLFGMQEGKFDAIFFWKKGAMHPEKGFATLNQILEELETDKHITMPTIKK